MTDLYQEHSQDSYCDTWQAMEAAQFLRDEAESAKAERAYEEAQLLEEFRENYPSEEPKASGLEVALTRLFKQDGLI